MTIHKTTPGPWRLQKWLPVVKAEFCTGCGKCVEACGPQSLAIVNGISVLVDANSCGSEEHCIGPCPEQCIEMAWVDATGDPSRGIWRQAPALPVTS
ncbi:MAG: 4Fe-4S binding protein [Candidatus Sumerlaeaceae bacterium]|nr:4Fe-4S binding protein [Candidatus Sumerlaeaceae bacterium]